MSGIQKNYYGSLCTEMYEILHKAAPEDELNFYLSYAREGMKILEPLCGSGRFLVPFWKKGLDIQGVDLSGEMLEKLKGKAPDARVTQADLLTYDTQEKFDYIFISSGSMSLFTDLSVCRAILKKMRTLLAAGGKFVFAAETVGCRRPDEDSYQTAVSVKSRDGYDFLLKMKCAYDEKKQTQFMPSLYELYDGGKLLQSETMDFQTHLYRFGEMEEYLRDAGFSEVVTYSGFDKAIALNDLGDMFLYECRA